MLPLIVSGVFVAVLMLIEKLCEPSERWKSREEQQNFRKEREKWIYDGWNLYR